MNILSRLLLRLGYVRLRDYGYTLTRDGRIVEMPRVTDDRFAPPPWEPIAWQSAVAFLPTESPPVPRPLPPAPRPEEAANTTGTVRAPETAAPVAVPLAGTTGAHPLGATSVAPASPVQVEDEEWEWRMALARARERAARDAARSREADLARLPHPATAGETRPIDLGRAATQPGAGPARPPASGDGARIFGPPPHASRSMLGLPASARGPARDEGSDFAEGSRRHPITRSEAGDLTATDVSIIAAREDDETSVDATATRLARALHPEADPLEDPAMGETVTTVMEMEMPPAGGESSLPRATTRLRRTTPV
jgi:hypothetical protein